MWTHTQNQRDVEVLQNELKSVKTKYGDRVSVLKESQRRMSKLKKEMAAARLANGKLESSCSEYKERIAEYSKEMKTLTASQGDARSQCEEMEKRVQGMKEEMDRVQQRYDNAKRDVIDAETVRMSFGVERDALNSEIRRYNKEMEGLQLRMQSLWRRYESERSKAKMWKLKLKTFTKQQKHRGANINEWLLECRENEFELNDFDGLDQAIFERKVGELEGADSAPSGPSGDEGDSGNGGDGECVDGRDDGDDDDDDVLSSPIPFPSPFVTKRGLDAVNESMSRKESDGELNEKEEASSESENDEDIDLDTDLALSFLSPINSNRSKSSGSDVSTPSQFAYSAGSPSVACSDALDTDCDSEVSLGQ